MSSPQKGSTEGTSSGPDSVVTDEHIQQQELCGNTNDDGSNRFNLRDRKKICYNKKYGGFVFYNQDEAIEGIDNENERIETNGEPEEGAEEAQNRLSTRVKAVKKGIYVDEFSDDDFQLR